MAMQNTAKQTITTSTTTFVSAPWIDTAGYDRYIVQVKTGDQPIVCYVEETNTLENYVSTSGRNVPLDSSAALDLAGGVSANSYTSLPFGGTRKISARFLRITTGATAGGVSVVEVYTTLQAKEQGR